MSILNANYLFYLQDTHDNFRFFADSGASRTALLHADTAPPTGLYLVGANGKTIPFWGYRHFTVCFSGQNFAFNFFATPLLGMDFLTHFGLSVVPSACGQGLHLRQGKYHILFTPPRPRKNTGAAVAELPTQVQQLLREFPTLLRPSAAPPPPPETPPRRCAPHQHRKRRPRVPPLPGVGPVQSPYRRGGVSRHGKSRYSKQVFSPTRLGRPRCPWYPRKTAPDTPAATTANRTQSPYPTGTPFPTCLPRLRGHPHTFRPLEIPLHGNHHTMPIWLNIGGSNDLKSFSVGGPL
jgi:hypothetical protein